MSDCGIVHLGIGNFHRAHQAFYVDQLLNLEPQSGGGPRLGSGWAIAGASLQTRGVVDKLKRQNFSYTLVERDGNQSRYRRIRAIHEALFAPDDPQALVDRMSSPDTHLITLTITEKGYTCSSPLDKAPSGVPKTAIDFLSAAFERRRETHSGPVTVLSCDNLPSNGKLLRSAIMKDCLKTNPSLLGWIERNVSFPCTVVDRIVPALSPEQLDELERELGYRDEVIVVTEPYSQWIIEDCFASKRPEFERVGVSFVSDVEPFEKIKLRLLNGTHSALAYIGGLMGFKTVDQAVSYPPLQDFVIRMVEEEVIPTLKIPAGFNPRAYYARLIERFKNSALKHRLAQIATDGSQKLPQRILAPIRERLRENQPISRLAYVVAAWMKYVLRNPVSDPLSERFDAIRRKGKPSPLDLASAFLTLEEVFGVDLPQEIRFRKVVGDDLCELSKKMDSNIL